MLAEAFYPNCCTHGRVRVPPMEGMAMAFRTNFRISENMHRFRKLFFKCIVCLGVFDETHVYYLISEDDSLRELGGSGEAAIETG